MRRLASVLALAAASLAAAQTIPEAPTQWVTDEVGLLSEPTRRSLNDRLRAYQEQTGHHVLVWISRTTGGVPIEEFAVKAFEAWGVGRKGIDDGLVLFVFTEDRKLRIEVGYDLEDRVPDAIASRVIREVIVPRMQAGDGDGAIAAGTSALIDAIEGRPGALDQAPAPPGRAPPAGRPLGTAELIVLGVVGLFFLILLVTNPGLAIYLLFNILSSGSRGGGRGGYSGGGHSGGGWSGGGGRSGGGGATGSW